jgi:S1-C subfamily serine protease
VYSLLFLAALPGQFVNAKDFPQERQQAALEATVRLYHPGTPLYGESFGSGVIVGRKDKVVYLLTADHNMPPGNDVKTVELMFFTKKSYPNPSAEDREARIVERMPEVDLAVIEAVLPDHPGLLRICPRDQLSQVRILGPGSRSISVLALGTDVGNRAPTIWPDEVSDVRQAKPDSKALFYEARRAPVEGRSGGPLVDKRGYLIGICSGRRGEKKGYYLYIEDIRAALEHTPYKFLNGDQKPPAK